MGWVAHAVDADIYPIEVSFQVLAAKKERDYLNQLRRHAVDEPPKRGGPT